MPPGHGGGALAREAASTAEGFAELSERVDAAAGTLEGASPPRAPARGGGTSDGREWSTTYEEASRAFSILVSAAAPDDGVVSKADVLTQSSFQLGATRLGLTYFRKAEVDRVWKIFDSCRDLSRGTEVSRDCFSRAALQHDTVRHLVPQVLALVAASCFEVPQTYDYSAPTCANYAVKRLALCGRYIVERAPGPSPRGRDYSYHAAYSCERMAWQDEVVRLTVIRHHPQPRPWIVFTCGAMGCGKGYTFELLSERGYFPMEDIVRVDPDYFKSLMPEWRGYIERGIDAGTMTHRESTFLQEICQEAALRRQQNIWVDGSLRDASWFRRVFEDIRARFPVYRIGIIHVHASEPVVRERIAERAARTGRGVPEKLIRESLNAPRRTMFELSSLCDWVARIDNEHTPRLVSFAQVDRSAHWGAMAQRWARTEAAPNEFPNRMAPWALEVVEGWQLQGCLKQDGGCATLVRSSAPAPGQATSGGPASVKLQVGPVQHILVSQSVVADIARRQLAIDEETMQVTHVMPTGLVRTGSGACSSSGFEFGGFLYFDRLMNLIVAVRVAGQCATCRFRHYLHFHDPIVKSRAELRAQLADASRWREVTMPELRAGGARRCTWVRQGELPEVRNLGAWVFALEDGRFILVSIRVPLS